MELQGFLAFLLAQAWGVLLGCGTRNARCVSAHTRSLQRHRPILACHADGKRAVGSLCLGKRIVERLSANRFSKRSNCDAWTVILVRKMHANYALFDVQVKRIHEYKRQMLNVLHIIARYNEMLAHPEKDWQPRVFILAGKAASAYYAAKQTIRLINDVANVINNDERLKGRLKVVFIPNYSVSLAQLIIPAADISEQISLAGTEASGTSNMKFALNGALTLGTLDGANVEILDNVGKDHIFIFGNTVEQVEALRREGYRPFDYYQNDEQLREVIDQIIRGDFSPEEPNRYHSLIQGLQYHDYYQSFADFRSYVEAQKAVDKKYQDRDAWIASTIQNMVNMGFFSSDRTILEYAKNIWKIEPLKLEK